MSEDRLWDVEEIVDKAINPDNTEKFKIHWVGYSSVDDSWEGEDNCLPACYNLIRIFEETQFREERDRNEAPKVIRFRRVTNEFKLLVEWPTTKTRQYYYSSVIQSVDQNFLIDFYEQHITDIPRLDNVDEWAHFVQEGNTRILNNDRPQKIILLKRCGNEKVCLVQWQRHGNEVNFVDYNLIRLNYPHILIQFYELYLIPNDDIMNIVNLKI